VPPGTIVHKLRRRHVYVNDIMPGNWDLVVGLPELSPKHRSVRQHFQEGIPWEATDLFKEGYSRRLARGGTIRGAKTLDELKRYYETHIDPLFDEIKENGFAAVDKHGRSQKLPHVYIARNGDILFGNNGNHRLAIANILRIDRMPCQVRARHLGWQMIREQIAKYGPDECWNVVDPKFATHPDLADLLGSPPEGDRETNVGSEAMATRSPANEKVRS
jgi:hypothetical protein